MNDPLRHEGVIVRLEGSAVREFGTPMTAYLTRQFRKHFIHVVLLILSDVRVIVKPSTHGTLTAASVLPRHLLDAENSGSRLMKSPVPLVRDGTPSPNFIFGSDLPISDQLWAPTFPAH